MENAKRLAGMANDTLDVMGRRKTGRRDGLTAAKREHFLNVLAETCCVRQAVSATGRLPASIYARRRNDPVFAGAWLEALSMGYDAVEARVMRYVLDGGEPGDVEPDGGAGAAGIMPGSRARGERSDRLMFGTAPAWVQVALHLLNRHRSTVQGRNRGMKIGKPATPEETDAVLMRRLDHLARVRARKAERQAASDNAPVGEQATTVPAVADQTGGSRG